MTKPHFTDITIVLDASGSMRIDAEKTKAAINEFLSIQKQVPGECRLTLIMFNARTGLSYLSKSNESDWYNKVFDNVALQDVAQFSHYECKGYTALYDATDKAINETGQRLSALPEYDRPSQVLFVIMTDGQENSSSNTTLLQLKDKIQHQKNVYSWNFVFLGADFNSEEYTSSLALNSAQSSFNYDKANTIRSWKGLGKAVGEYRTSGLSVMPENFAVQADSYAKQESN